MQPLPETTGISSLPLHPASSTTSTLSPPCRRGRRTHPLSPSRGSGWSGTAQGPGMSSAPSTKARAVANPLSFLGTNPFRSSFRKRNPPPPASFGWDLFRRQTRKERIKSTPPPLPSIELHIYHACGTYRNSQQLSTLVFGK